MDDYLIEVIGFEESVIGVQFHLAVIVAVAVIVVDHDDRIVQG